MDANCTAGSCSLFFNIDYFEAFPWIETKSVQLDRLPVKIKKLDTLNVEARRKQVYQSVSTTEGAIRWGAYEQRTVARRN